MDTSGNLKVDFNGILYSTLIGNQIKYFRDKYIKDKLDSNYNAVHDRTFAEANGLNPDSLDTYYSSIFIRIF